MDEKKAAQVKKMEAESEALMQAIRAELDIQKKQKLIARREKQGSQERFGCLLVYCA